jgi:hypothetical protein
MPPSTPSSTAIPKFNALTKMDAWIALREMQAAREKGLGFITELEGICDALRQDVSDMVDDEDVTVKEAARLGRTVGRLEEVQRIIRRVRGAIGATYRFEGRTTAPIPPSDAPVDVKEGADHDE